MHYGYMDHQILHHGYMDTWIHGYIHHQNLYHGHIHHGYMHHWYMHHGYMHHINMHHDNQGGLGCFGLLDSLSENLQHIGSFGEAHFRLLHLLPHLSLQNVWFIWTLGSIQIGPLVSTEEIILIVEKGGTNIDGGSSTWYCNNCKVSNVLALPEAECKSFVGVEATWSVLIIL